MVESDEALPRTSNEKFWDEKGYIPSSYILRFLRSRAGMPWNDVYAEISSAYTNPADRRAFDKYVFGVSRYGVPQNKKFFDFFVDDEGILRHRQHKKSRSFPRLSNREKNDFIQEICSWLGIRKIVSRDGHYYWLVPNDDRNVLPWRHSNFVLQSPQRGASNWLNWREYPFSTLRWRENGALSKAEKEKWEKFPEQIRKLFM